LLSAVLVLLVTGGFYHLLKNFSGTQV
jgi:hypothetical protein